MAATVEATEIPQPALTKLRPNADFSVVKGATVSPTMLDTVDTPSHLFHRRLDMLADVLYDCLKEREV